MTESELWLAYESNPSDYYRNKIIEHYLPYAKTLAIGFYRNWLASEIALEDLVQLATVGLIEAIDSFQLQNTAAFKSYARYRIRGSMLNAISRYSENLSFTSYKRKMLKDRIESLENLISRSELSQFDRFVKITVGSAYVEILNELDFSDENAKFLTNNYEQTLDDVLKMQMFDLIGKLSERDRSIVHLHYIEGLTFTEIAKTLKISKATVSLSHGKAILKLQEMRRGKKKIAKRF